MYCKLEIGANETNIFIPMHYVLQSKLDWLAGFLEPYVCNLKTQTPDTLIEIQCKSHVFLQDLKRMLQTCGINTYIRSTEDANYLIVSILKIKRLMTIKR